MRETNGITRSKRRLISLLRNMLNLLRRRMTMKRRKKKLWQHSNKSRHGLRRREKRKKPERQR